MFQWKTVSVTLVIGNRNVAIWYHINYVTDQISMEWGRNTVLSVISNSTKKIHFTLIIHDWLAGWLCRKFKKEHPISIFAFSEKIYYESNWPTQGTNYIINVHYVTEILYCQLSLLFCLSLWFKLNVYTIWPLFCM